MTISKYKELSTDQLFRYSRHIQLKSMDIDGQEKLYNAKVLIIGLGGLGCAASQYLAASGVGALTLVDDDIVDKTNLQRQVLHGEPDVGSAKCISARQALEYINSEITLHTIQERLSGDALARVIAEHDLVLDCCDNITTRNAINQYAFAHKVPLVSGAAIRMEGQVAVFDMQDNHACYQCLSHSFKDQTLTCAEAGVLSPLVGMVGSIQAIEAIKLIAQVGVPLSGRLMLIDAFNMDTQIYTLPKIPHCRVCR
ncbi:molybdopterin-synthase adenylyltransferase MoeB [Pseudoalteromonas sp. S4741]|uniref:molybdopterin-synthase adenylyltransferase MoeB n=1 Tax=Pseudoalteromonas sp. S4741 TaxID=579563 RepID=UPI00110AC2F3|nr:molybdopterin-synthase adenylyltransferase MoeB [Pseudoalteromonas sp. S4741]TMO28196.1 molybdopterin-synthase adenylyltransferase MoeB [Pseudoalteromonas sp. S4741]